MSSVTAVGAFRSSGGDTASFGGAYPCRLPPPPPGAAPRPPPNRRRRRRTCRLRRRRRRRRRSRCRQPCRRRAATEAPPSPPPAPPPMPRSEPAAARRQCHLRARRRAAEPAADLGSAPPGAPLHLAARRAAARRAWASAAISRAAGRLSASRGSASSRLISSSSMSSSKLGATKVGSAVPRPVRRRRRRRRPASSRRRDVVDAVSRQLERARSARPWKLMLQLRVDVHQQRSCCDPVPEIAVLLALRCFHSICEAKSEALPLQKRPAAAIHHGGGASCCLLALARCITRVAQLIICFRVARLYFSARVVIVVTRVVAAPRHTLTYPTWRNCAVAPRERSTSSEPRRSRRRDDETSRKSIKRPRSDRRDRRSVETHLNRIARRRPRPRLHDRAANRRQPRVPKANGWPNQRRTTPARRRGRRQR